MRALDHAFNNIFNGVDMPDKKLEVGGKGELKLK
jgi:hypothetical protein